MPLQQRGTLQNAPAACCVLQSPQRATSNKLPPQLSRAGSEGVGQAKKPISTLSSGFSAALWFPKALWPNIWASTQHGQQKLLLGPYIFRNLGIGTHALYLICKTYKARIVTPKSTAFIIRLQTNSYKKPSASKIVKLAAHAIILKNWFKCPLKTFLSKTSSWQVLVGDFTSVLQKALHELRADSAHFDQPFTILLSYPHPHLTATWLRTLSNSILK